MVGVRLENMQAGVGYTWGVGWMRLGMVTGTETGIGWEQMNPRGGGPRPGTGRVLPVVCTYLGSTRLQRATEHLVWVCAGCQCGTLGPRGRVRGCRGNHDKDDGWPRGRRLDQGCTQR